MIDSVAYFFYYVFSGIISFFSYIFSIPWLFGFWTFSLTVILAYVAFIAWRHYVQQKFISGIDWVLLEIVPPRDVERSPKAMELFFSNALYQITQKSLWEKYITGATIFNFSLEIVSLGGQVHFFIRAPRRVKELIETQMYAQYPQAQIKEVDDYTLAVDKISKDSKWNLWGCEFGLEKHEIYPVKTYVDFGLEKDPKEEFKVDPISPVIELFGSIGKDEQMWCQIVVAASSKKYHTKGTWFKKHGFKDEAEKQIYKLLKPFTSVKDEGARIEVRVPDFLKKPVEGITNKMSKLIFDCGIRVCYVAKKEAFIDNSRRNLRLIFRQYSLPFVNSFSRLNSTQFQYPWQFTKKSLLKLKDRMLEEYRNRLFFYLPMRHHIPVPWPITIFFPKYSHHKIIVLNTEELATIWHFPGQILKVPTLERIESREATPPSNLPI
ncbi:MAG: hypothetical protein WA101_03215 [Minisyncoccia bacterium]